MKTDIILEKNLNKTSEFLRGLSNQELLEINTAFCLEENMLSHLVYTQEDAIGKMLENIFNQNLCNGEVLQDILKGVEDGFFSIEDDYVLYDGRVCMSSNDVKNLIEIDLISEIAITKNISFKSDAFRLFLDNNVFNKELESEER